MESPIYLSPAKLNLYLAVTGRRDDDFHDLVSLAVPLAWGDELGVSPAEGFSLECDHPDVPTDATNLVLRAAEAFREATGWEGGAHFELRKRIPVGAGLGGGSSNAATALRALNALAGQPLDTAGMMALSARVGSDCALFQAGGAAVLRGRGERVEPVSSRTTARLRGRRVIVFKPSVGVSTAWAYARLAAGAPAAYLPAATAEARLAAWLGNATAPWTDLLYNSFEPPVFAKFPALPLLLDELRVHFGLPVGMSGSGSACFALPQPDTPESAVIARIREAWGDAALAVTTELA